MSGDWSSDVCSSDLEAESRRGGDQGAEEGLGSDEAQHAHTRRHARTTDGGRAQAPNPSWRPVAGEQFWRGAEPLRSTPACGLPLPEVSLHRREERHCASLVAAHQRRNRERSSPLRWYLSSNSNPHIILLSLCCKFVIMY